MRRLFPLLLQFVCVASAAVVIDRIAVIAGKHVVKLSDVDRELRVTNFLNREPLLENAATKRKAADRLVDQQLIRDELATGGYERATDADAAKMLNEIRQNRYAGSASRFTQALSQYGLTEDELRAQLLWQMTVLRFIDQRFRTGVLVTDEEVRAYYDQHPDVGKVSFQAAAPRIRTMLEGEQVNTQFEEWLSDRRKQEKIQYLEGAF